MESNPIKVPRFTVEEGFFASQKSSVLMRKIKLSGTKPEIYIRKALWRKGHRYRLKKKGLSGKPDIIFSKVKMVVFIDGDFWHGHNWMQRKPKLKINKIYWIAKIERNMQRDNEINQILRLSGWKVIRIWEHQVLSDIDYCVRLIEEAF